MSLGTVAAGSQALASGRWRDFVEDADAVQQQLFAKAKAADSVATRQVRDAIRSSISGSSEGPGLPEDSPGCHFSISTQF